MFRLRLVEIMVQEIWKKKNNLVIANIDLKLLCELTWNTMWLRLSWSRSRGFRSFKVFPCNEKIGSVLTKTNSREMSARTPNIGSSEGEVCCATTEKKSKLVSITKNRSNFNYNDKFSQLNRQSIEMKKNIKMLKCDTI